MSLADQIVDFFSSLKSNNTKGTSNNDVSDQTQMPPISVVRSPDIQYGSSAIGASQPKIERDLVKVGDMQSMSQAEYDKLSDPENLADLEGGSQLPTKDSTTPTVPTATATTTAAQPAASNDDYIKSMQAKYGVSDYNIAKTIVNTAKQFGESPDIMFRMAKQESKFNPKIVNANSGAQGLFQFLPSTWQDVKDRLAGTEHKVNNPLDPQQNATAAALYLQDIKSQISKVKPGNQITDGDLYLGHFSGAGRATQVIQAIQKGKGGMPASKVYKPDEISNNKPIFYNGYYKTIGKQKVFVPTTLKTIKGVYDTIASKVQPDDTMVASADNANKV